MSTPSAYPLCHDDHFILAQNKTLSINLFSYTIFHPRTSLIRQNVCGVLRVGGRITDAFDCVYISFFFLLEH